MDWKISADVIVVGAGYAGLRAAVAAHDSGSEVLVLEKLEYLLREKNNSIKSNK